MSTSVQNVKNVKLLTIKSNTLPNIPKKCLNTRNSDYNCMNSVSYQTAGHHTSTVPTKNYPHLTKKTPKFVWQASNSTSDTEPEHLFLSDLEEEDEENFEKENNTENLKLEKMLAKNGGSTGVSSKSTDSGHESVSNSLIKHNQALQNLIKSPLPIRLQENLQTLKYSVEKFSGKITPKFLAGFDENTSTENINHKPQKLLDNKSTKTENLKKPAKATRQPLAEKNVLKRNKKRKNTEFNSHNKNVKLLKTRAATFTTVQQLAPQAIFADVHARSKTCEPEKEARQSAKFLKSIQHKRFIEWSEDKADYLTLQNYMTSLRMAKCKFPKHLNEHILKRHPQLENRMRGILLDWLMEVCDCFNLQRSTFYLAQSYLDMYLAKNGMDIPESDSRADDSSFKSDFDRHSTDSAYSSPSKSSSKSKKETYVSEKIDTTVSKSQLQLLGITCLFVASKVEEIDPPRLAKFAFITDGACSVDDILLHELTLLQSLDWLTHPVTAYDWLRLYLQTTYFYLVKKRTKNTKAAQTSPGQNSNTSTPNSTSSPNLPKSLNNFEVSKDYIEKLSFTPIVFAQMCQLLDLATLDMNCLKFKPHELAASILYHFSSQATTKKASNLNMNNLVDCVSWLTSMALTLRDCGLLNSPTEWSEREDNDMDFRRSPSYQWYNIQLHKSEMLDLLEKANDRRKMVEERGNRRK